MIVNFREFRGKWRKWSFINRVVISKVEGDRDIEVDIVGEGIKLRVNGIVIKI